MTQRVRLDGLKVIASWLRLSERQVRKLAHRSVPQEYRLPVFRLTLCNGRNSRVYAYVDDLQAWEQRMAERYRSAS